MSLIKFKYDGQKYIFWTLLAAILWTVSYFVAYKTFMPVWATALSVILFVGIGVLNLMDKSILGVDPPKSYLFIWGPVLALLTILIGVANSNIIK